MDEFTNFMQMAAMVGQCLARLLCNTCWAGAAASDGMERKGPYNPGIPLIFPESPSRPLPWVLYETGCDDLRRRGPEAAEAAVTVWPFCPAAVAPGLHFVQNKLRSPI